MNKLFSVGGWVLALIAGASIVWAQVPMFQGTKDYLVTWPAPGAQRTITVVDPGTASKLYFEPTSTPVVSTCTNGSLAAGSTDAAGRISVSGGATTACTVTFGTAYATNPPACVVIAKTAGIVATVNTSTTAMVIAFSSTGVANGDQADYICQSRS